MPQKEKTVTLARLHSAIKTDNEVVNINLLILFSQLILLAECEKETRLFFEYELTNYPLSLLKDGMMRNGNKASLYSFLLKVIPSANLPTEIVQVNDGEALLFEIKSFYFTKLSDTDNLYKKHLHGKCGYCYDVFDCCESSPSIKDKQRPNRSGRVLPDITFTSDEKCVKSHEDFLDNQNNKACFIVGLTNHLSQTK